STTQTVDARSRDRDRISRQIFRDYVAVAIVNDAAWGRQRNRPQPIFLGLHHVLLVLHDLCLEERADEQYEAEAKRERAHSRAAGDVVRMKAHAGVGSSRGRIMNSNSTPTAAVTAADSGDHSNSCCSTSTP